MGLSRRDSVAAATRRSIPRHRAFQVCSTTMMDGQNNGSAQVTYDGDDI
jgi:hypothetical protein